MDPVEFLRFAEKTLCRDDGPASCRSAISRAYYAAFLSCRERLESVGVDVPHNATGHNEVQRKLSRSGDPRYRKVASDLGNLQSQRLTADYDLSKAVVEKRENAQLWLATADRIVQTVAGLPTDASLKAIVTAIRS
jgi:uncharacterized protein (UPF0332 family)